MIMIMIIMLIIIIIVIISINKLLIWCPLEHVKLMKLLFSYIIIVGFVNVIIFIIIINNINTLS